MIRKKVGFIGSGYMGFGMAKNLIKNFDVEQKKSIIEIKRGKTKNNK